MKRSIVVVVILLSLPLVVTAQKKGADKRSVEQTIRRLEDEGRAATLKNDLAATDRLLADDWMNTNANGTVTTKAQLLENAKALPTGDRIDLAMELWDTVGAAHIGTSISPSLREELRRRVAEDEADPQPAENWDELRSKLLRGEI